MSWIRQKNESDWSPEPNASKPAQPYTAPQPTREKGMEKSIVNIGQSVQIRGELSGNEDLTIEGNVDGKIVVKDHNVTIGANGRITAEIHAKTVVIVGQVNGNITADDKVEIAPTGSLVGDIRAPRVAISDGARFKGSVDMERKSAAPLGKSAGHASHAVQEMPRSAKAIEG
jgi:cytoskeletal protein CcmA (bactofilin family)